MNNDISIFQSNKNDQDNIDYWEISYLISSIIDLILMIKKYDYWLVYNFSKQRH